MELREQRRMRSGELHYLDHPKFGVLARVDPIHRLNRCVAELARLAALPAHRQRPLSRFSSSSMNRAISRSTRLMPCLRDR